MFRVGVSGLTGMIGRNLLDHCRRDPQAGAALSLVAITRRDRAPDYLERTGVPCRRVDYGDPASFAGAMEDLDAFVHLAGQVRAADPREYFRVNRDGTTALLEALSRFGARMRHFLFASSQAASGPSGRGRAPGSEGAPCRPVSHYGRSKLEAEEAVRASPLNWTILRLSSVWGPYDLDGLAILKAARRGVLPVLGGTPPVLSYIFAQDLARLLVKMIGNERLYRGTFNVCYDEPVCVADYCLMVRCALALPPRLLRLPLPRWTGYAAMGLLALIRRACGGDSIANPDKVREMMATWWVQSNDRLKAALGLPALRESGALAETVRWFQEHHLL
jgi:nucleoside-diphosphate-sugar epimerase